MTQNRIIVAFDAMDMLTATTLGLSLHGLVAGGKANDLLDEVGATALNIIFHDQLHAASAGSGEAPLRMADPKIHDIPNTVKNRVQKYGGRADFVTIHGCNSFKSLVAAKNASLHSGHDLKIIVVTVTTDIDNNQCRSIFGTYKVREKVRLLVHRAKMAGLHGIVCSPKEVKLVRAWWPSAIIIVPGVRSPGADQHDQVRVGTPEQAIQDGADYIVCGREITAAADPVAAAKHINDGVERGLTTH